MSVAAVPDLTQRITALVASAGKTAIYCTAQLGATHTVNTQGAVTFPVGREFFAAMLLMQAGPPLSRVRAHTL